MSSFFEEYKSLDNLCRDILESEKGVSEYIERMEKDDRGRMLVVDWDRDYKKLKSLRYIRNRLAHEDGAYEKDLCSDKDIAWISDFIARIMDETDPLTVLMNYDSAENEGQKVSETPPKSAEKGQKVSPTGPKNEPREDSYPDYPRITDKKPIQRSAPKVQSESKPKRKKSPPPSEAETTYRRPISPKADPVTVISAILLIIGVAWSLIVSLG